MKKIPIYQVDAFTSRVFSGNPAAVCPLDRWPDDQLLLQIARENNLSETAFFVRKKGFYELRWFTPETEVDLCGHGTLAAAYVISSQLAESAGQIVFQTLSGRLEVEVQDGLISMLFPSRPAERETGPAELLDGLGLRPVEILKSRDYLAVFRSEEEIKSLQVDLAKLSSVDTLGIIVTAPGKDVDFVSRFFAPRVGIPEDPVTGSAHCTLIPYWAEKLQKKELKANQLSIRGGEILCTQLEERVRIAGHAVLYLKGNIFL